MRGLFAFICFIMLKRGGKLEPKRQSFVKGAMVLMLANIIVKVIGMVFKIPLSHILGRSGMGIFTTAYSLYASLFVIATAGLPVAVSKMVSESGARGRHGEGERIFKIAAAMLTGIGLLGAVLFYFGADFLAKTVRDPLVADGIRMISPAIFFVALTSALRGYFQGNHNMTPTAASEIVEAAGKLILGLSLAYLMRGGGGIRAAAGAVAGVTAGTALGAALLIFYYFAWRKRHGVVLRAGEPTRRRRQIALTLLGIALPITIGASVSSLTNIIDTVTIRARLQEIGYTIDASREMFGAYQGHAVTMFNMPITLVVAISMSIVPAVSSALAVQNFEKARRSISAGLQITMLLAIPSAVGLSVLAAPILQLIFRDVFAASQLAILAYAVIFVSLVSVSTAVLQAAGRVYTPVLNMTIGGVIKVLVNYVLVGIPEVNINGASVGTICCYATIAVLNLVAVSRVTGFKFKFVAFLIKPAISAAAMGAAAFAIYTWMPGGGTVRLGAAILGAVAIYVFALFALGAVRREELEMMPLKGLPEKIKKFGFLK